MIIRNNLEKFIDKVSIIKYINDYDKLQLKNIISKFKKDSSIISKTIIFLYGYTATCQEVSYIYNLRVEILNEIRNTLI